MPNDKDTNLDSVLSQINTEITHEKKNQNRKEKSIQNKDEHNQNNKVTPTQTKAKNSQSSKVTPTQTKAKNSQSSKVTPTQTKAKNSQNSKVTPTQTKAKNSQNSKVTPTQAKAKNSQSNEVTSTQPKSEHNQNNEVASTQTETEHSQNNEVTSAQTESKNKQNNEVTSAQTETEHSQNKDVEPAQTEAENTPNNEVAPAQPKAKNKKKKNRKKKKPPIDSSNDITKTQKDVKDTDDSQDSVLLKPVTIIAVEPTLDDAQSIEERKYIHVVDVESTPPLEAPSFASQELSDNKKKTSKAELKRKNGTAVARDSSPVKTPSKKQKQIALLGIAIAFFVVIGAISTIWSTVNFTADIVNETSLKKELERAIFPLVIIDAPEFEDSTNLDNSAIIASSIWGFIIHEEDKSKYKKDDLGAIYVPDADIEKYIRRLYGPDVTIQHQSINDASVQMTYNPESNYYIIESTPTFLPYTPRVDKISKSKDILTLRVSYILPDVMLSLNTDEKNQVVDKVMEFQVKEIDDHYQLLSLRLIEVTAYIGTQNPM